MTPRANCFASDIATFSLFREHKSVSECTPIRFRYFAVPPNVHRSGQEHDARQLAADLQGEHPAMAKPRYRRKDDRGPDSRATSERHKQFYFETAFSSARAWSIWS
jgi:hypothetical protein